MGKYASYPKALSVTPVLQAVKRKVNGETVVLSVLKGTLQKSQLAPGFNLPSADKILLNLSSGSIL